MSRSHLPLARRDFVKQAGIWAALGLGAKAAPSVPGEVAIVLADQSAPAAPEKWAAQQLQMAIHDKGGHATIVKSAGESPNARMLVVAGRKSLGRAGGDALSLAPETVNGRPAIVVSGSASRGGVYGLLELADSVRHGLGIETALTISRPVAEQSPNQIRSIARAFCSEIEDKPWYYDKDFWRGYLTELATQRFNRFNLTFGLGYDFPRGVTGDYFHFLYPYLLDVPGYNVRAVPLSDAERDRNLETLRFIAAETATRGLEFQLGIWTHAYEWVDSPKAHHHVEGLTPANHAAYCRDALALLLKTCPEIQGLTLRVHGESGIP
ncbi:MAG TPA: hypothetical protein VG168_06320, partial [Bryobacteraceae bacterium]|nr:hypothetical protein [Bryobacteraceae bacterium]